MITLYTVSSMEKIMPKKQPCAIEKNNVILSNEKLNFQLAIYNDGNENLRLNTVKIRGELAQYVTLRTAELIPSTLCAKDVDDYYITDDVGVFPDLLRPIGKAGITLSAKQWKALWVSVYSEDGLRSGENTLFFDICNENGEILASTDYGVTVLDKKLPKTDLKITNWMHYDCICNEHNVEPFTSMFYKVFDSYMDAYLACGNNMLLVPIFTPPLDTKIGGERKTCQLVRVIRDKNGYAFDFSMLEEFVRFVMNKGIEYLEFSHLFTQWGGESCPKIIATVDGKEEQIFGWDNKSDSVEYVEFLDAFLPELVAFVTKLGLKDKCYFHLTDEPNDSHLLNYEKCRFLVKKHLDDLPVMDALSKYAYYEKGLVDIPVVSTPHYPQFKENGVKNVWAYYCLWPSNDYYCNRFLNMPLQRTRILGFQLYENDAQGFLHWGFNFYNTAFSMDRINPYQDTSAGGFFPSGDSFIVYPTEGGALMSVRGEIMREAVQDYCLCKLAEQVLGKAETKKLLEPYGIQGFNRYPRCIDKHNEMRRVLIKAINKNG